MIGAVRRLPPRFSTAWMKSTSRRELRSAMPASAIMPTIAVAVKYTGFAWPSIIAPPYSLSSQKPGIMPMIVNGIETIRTSGLM